MAEALTKVSPESRAAVSLNERAWKAMIIQALCHSLFISFDGGPGLWIWKRLAVIHLWLAVFHFRKTAMAPPRLATAVSRGPPTSDRFFHHEMGVTKGNWQHKEPKVELKQALGKDIANKPLTVKLARGAQWASELVVVVGRPFFEHSGQAHESPAQSSAEFQNNPVNFIQFVISLIHTVCFSLIHAVCDNFCFYF